MTYNLPIEIHVIKCNQLNSRGTSHDNIRSKLNYRNWITPTLFLQNMFSLFCNLIIISETSFENKLEMTNSGYSHPQWFSINCVNTQSRAHLYHIVAITYRLEEATSLELPTTSKHKLWMLCHWEMRILYGICNNLLAQVQVSTTKITQPVLANQIQISLV